MHWKRKQKIRRKVWKATVRSVSTLLLLLIFVAQQAQLIGAFEAHVVNVTATIVDRCQLGYSISGMKYNDEDKDQVKDSGEEGLGGWIISLYKGTYKAEFDYDSDGLINSADRAILQHVIEDGLLCPLSKNCDFNNDLSQTFDDVIDFTEYITRSDLGNKSTNADGTYSFGGLEAGDYTIGEAIQSGWKNSTPLIQHITLNCGENIINFGNYQESGPRCGNGFVDEGEECDDGNTINGDGCSSECKPEGGQCDAKSIGYWQNHEGCPTSSNWTNQIHNLSSDSLNGAFSSISGSDICVLLAPSNCPSGGTLEGQLCRAKGKILADESNIVSGKLDLSALVAGGDDGDIAFDNLGVSSTSTIRMALSIVEAVIIDSNHTIDQLRDAAYVAERVYSFYENENPNRPMCIFGGCGNGIIEQGEICDDGNTVNGDGCSAQCTPDVCSGRIVLDFDKDAQGNAILKGQKIDDEYASWGVSVQAHNYNESHPQIAITFDSSNPSGGINGDRIADIDLGTPNKMFGGPGDSETGNGFEPSNNTALHNLLIDPDNDIDTNPADGYIDDPNDEPQGGSLRFIFNRKFTFESVKYIDLDYSTGEVLGFADKNATTQLFSLAVPKGAGNSVQTVSGDKTTKIQYLKLRGRDSYAIDEVTLCPVIECGDGFVEGAEMCDDKNTKDNDGCSARCEVEKTQICAEKFNDENKNGIKDGVEAGIADWEIELKTFGQCSAQDEWADLVVFTAQGTKKDGTAVIPERSNATSTLSIAENDTLDGHFYSLGFGDATTTGAIILKFDNFILNQAGDDIEVFEASIDPSPDEKADVFVSQDGMNWLKAKTITKDGKIDISDASSDLEWIQYVKIIDVTDKTIHSEDADGFDLDGVRAIHCGSGFNLVKKLKTDGDGKVCFEDLEAGLYRIEEIMQDGWLNSTPVSQDIDLKVSDEINVQFGNYEEEEASNTIWLNEFVADPVGNDSQDGLLGEWVEIYNAGNISMDLNGYKIKDAAGGVITISSANTHTGSTIIGAMGSGSEWLVVFINKSFLNNTGDSILLYNSSDVLLDSTSFTSGRDSDVDNDPASTPGDENELDGNKSGIEGKSFARIPDGVGAWIDPVPTPGTPNKLDENSSSVIQDENMSTEGSDEAENTHNEDGSTISESDDSGIGDDDPSDDGKDNDEDKNNGEYALNAPKDDHDEMDNSEGSEPDDENPNKD